MLLPASGEERCVTTLKTAVYHTSLHLPETCKECLYYQLIQQPHSTPRHWGVSRESHLATTRGSCHSQAHNLLINFADLMSFISFMQEYYSWQ